MEALFGGVTEAEEMNVLYSQIKADPGFLLAFEEKQFVETPLHYAASEGRKQLALEIQRLMPSMGMKLNGDGFSPLHLALQRGHFETVRSMIRLNPKLVCVQGREGITPLHYAAETDNVDMLALFLTRCPESIEKLTVRMETAAHVAVNGQNLAAFEVLVGWMKWNGKGDVLNWKDWEGNTVLHLAAFINQPQFMDFIMGISILTPNNIALVISIAVMFWLLPLQSFNILLIISLVFLFLSTSLIIGFATGEIVFFFLIGIVMLGSIWVKFSRVKREIKMARYLALL